MRLMGTPPPEVYGISFKEIARLCHVSEKTAMRWKLGTSCPPESALLLLRGDLGMLAAEWSGWIIRGAELLSPEGWAITVNDVLASPLLRAQLAVYQAENRALRDTRDSLEEQPLPGEAPSQITA